MATEQSGNHIPIVFDGWRSLTISLYMALVGYSVMVSVPVLSTALVAMAGFSEEEVGRIWGADLGGFSVGAVFTALVVAKINRRLLVAMGVLVSIIGNALCIYMVDYEQVLWLRVLAGIGSGIFTAVAVVSLGGTTNPVRAFNMLLFGFAFSTAGELYFLPMMSMEQIYIFFIVLSLGCAAGVRWLPARPLEGEQLEAQQALLEEVENWSVPLFLPIFCLVAVCFTYINIGGYYTYVELAALADDVSQEWTTPVLTWSSIFAIVGCVIALWTERFGLFKPLFVSLVLMGLCVMMLSPGVTDSSFLISIFAFMTLWTFIDIYQSGMVSHMDRKGNLVALMPSVQGLGQSIGPNVAASVLGAGMGYSEVFIVSGSAALVALVIYMGVAFYMHRRPA